LAVRDESHEQSQDKTTVSGLVVVDKPPGCTSHDVVAKLRWIYGLRRVGHAGTLDPDATGVLLVGVGRITRLLRFLQGADKVYRTAIRFGVATNTLDAAGDVLDRRPMSISREQLATAARCFVGEIDQVPPMVSAIQIGGRRLHELARAGQEVERPPRRVRIERVEVEAFDAGPYPLATVLVECGSGTYIRSLAADLGAALGGCAHVETLRRLGVGAFGVDEARSLEEIEADPARAMLAPLQATRGLDRVDVDAEIERAVRHGMTFAAGTLGERTDAPFAVVGPDGTLLAVYERHRAGVKPAVVVVASN
jgi:tRNA pseudouridine55 synthase